MFLALKSIELTGFKSFGKKTTLVFSSPIASIVGPNGSGKSNVAEAFRFVLGEQSMKSMRSKRGEDLIWGGSPALPKLGRAAVKVVFDNSARLLDIDFSDVVIEREVYRDGQNEYRLNGSTVRLKDVIRLLAGANIGGSGYQIISQGEADRILNASPKERREMVEDALGLKLYQHKKAESEKKLEETAQNIDKTKSLRREIAPHLNFLRAQVEKVEKAREQKEELSYKFTEYLAREHAWITAEGVRISGDAKDAQARLHALEQQLHATRPRIGTEGETLLGELGARLAADEAVLREARSARDAKARELGRAEGALEVTRVSVEQVVAAPHVRQFAREVLSALEDAQRADMMTIRGLLAQVRGRIQAFIDGLSGAAPETSDETRRQVEALTAALASAESAERAALERVEAVRASIAAAREQNFAAQRASVEIESSAREARAALASAQAAHEALALTRSRFEDEVREGIILIGAAVHSWEKGGVPEGALSEDRQAQEKRRREIERLKIKIEEAGVGNGENIVREYTQTKERDEFLARELLDLEASAEKLRGIIADLEKTIDERFTEGLVHINEALGTFFSKLFGGGHASLDVETPRRGRAKKEADDEDIDEDDISEEEELYAGLSISVSLPRKKVRGLEVLSGGERALTSIALIFSMSQVNPPPFLILDETDAALDEANSKRYADMIRELGKKSQLIVITHNRATMAAAGELYGVTMDASGVSKILSVKLEEAERVAK